MGVDDRPAPVAFVDSRFPPVQDMRLGVGVIRVHATATVPTAGVGRHTVSYSNTHRSERSVYLVNVLVPAESRIRITGQRRDREQHGLRVDYDVAPARGAWIGWLFAALAMAVALGLTRWPARRA